MRGIRRSLHSISIDDSEDDDDDDDDTKSTSTESDSSPSVSSHDMVMTHDVESFSPLSRAAMKSSDTTEIECTICLEEIDGNDFIRCSRCRTHICVDCFEHTLKNNDGMCPNIQCLQSLAVQEVARRVNNPLLERVADRRKLREEDDRREQQKKDQTKSLELGRRYIRLASQRSEECREMQLRATACPKCDMPFVDYDGCNALRCVCGARFCGVCLKYSSNSAESHACARSHGDLYDKNIFHSARKAREERVLNEFIRKLRSDGVEELEIERFTKCLRMSSDNFSDAALSRASQAALVRMKRKISSVLQEERILVETRGSWVQAMERAEVPENIRIRFSRREGREDADDFELVFEERRTRKDDQNEDNVQETWVRLTKSDFKELNASNKDDERTLALRFVEDIWRERRHCCFLCDNEIDRAFQIEGRNLLLEFDPKDGVLNGERSYVRDLCARDATITHIRGIARLWELDRYVNEASFQLERCVCHYLGIGASDVLVKRSSELLGFPDSDDRELNTDQRSLVHPLTMLDARLVQGPPGTGKTRVISAIIKRLLDDTDLTVVVLSERNCAIDALAEKFYGACMTSDGEVRDFSFWRNILCDGSKSAGTRTKTFFAKEKVENDPRVVRATRVRDTIDRDLKNKRVALTKVLRPLNEFLNLVTERFKFASFERGEKVQVTLDFSDTWRCGTFEDETKDKKNGKVVWSIRLDKPAHARYKHRQIVKVYDYEERVRSLSLPDMDEVEKAASKLNCTEFGPLAERIQECMYDKNIFFEEEDFREWLSCWQDVDAIIEEAGITKEHRTILDRMGPTTSQLAQAFSAHLKHLTPDDMTFLERAERDLSKMERALNKLRTSVYEEYLENARVRMSTIASAHRLFKSAREEDDDIPRHSRRTVVIFDEASTIPSFEIIAAQRFCPNLAAIHVFGDKNQLPPFKRNRRGPPVESLIDCCNGVNVEKLTTQYRIPRDVANILDRRIYEGEYKSDESVSRGAVRFHFLNPPEQKHRRRRPKNHRDSEWDMEQASKAAQIAIRSQNSGKSVIIMTPYRIMCDKIRKIYDGMRKEMNVLRSSLHAIPHIKIETIHGTQGQQSDVVIICMVKTIPTPGFTKECFNVALSRTKEDLHILVSGRKKFLNFVTKGWLYSSFNPRNTRWRSKSVEDTKRVNENYRVVRNIFHDLLVLANVLREN